jgi:hypothetical protein
VDICDSVYWSVYWTPAAKPRDICTYEPTLPVLFRSTEFCPQSAARGFVWFLSPPASQRTRFLTLTL